MKFLLYPFSLLYRFTCWLRYYFYRHRLFHAKQAPLPVVSVGNISFGGSEKTPLAMNLIDALLKQGFKPALVSRGYRGRWEKQGGILSDGHKIQGDWKDSGDEPFMVAQNFPQAGVFIGKNRFLSCQEAKKRGFDIAVMDDGFQHHRLKRDTDIVLFNPGEKILLRESASSLKRCHIILVKKDMNAEVSQKMKKRFPQSSVYEYSVISKGFFPLFERQAATRDAFKDKKILAFCGIAHPERFDSLLKTQGIRPSKFLKFKDHHSYPAASIDKIKTAYETAKAEAIITTEKDAVKIASHVIHKDIPVYYLKIDLEIDPKFYLAVFSLLREKEMPVK